MDATLILCPKCQYQIQDSFNYCPNCRLNLQELRHITWDRQAVVYLVSLFLPPFGIVYATRYLKSQNDQVKMVGYIAIVLTIISLAVTILVSMDIGNQIQSAINKYSPLVQ